MKWIYQHPFTSANIVNDLLLKLKNNFIYKHFLSIEYFAQYYPTITDKRIYSNLNIIIKCNLPKRFFLMNCPINNHEILINRKLNYIY